MEVVYERCAGLDVHKKSITACVLWALPKGKKKQEKRRSQPSHKTCWRWRTGYGKAG